MKALIVPFTEGPGGPYPSDPALGHAHMFFPAIADPVCMEYSNAFIYPLSKLSPLQQASLIMRGAIEGDTIEGEHDIPVFDMYQDEREHSPQTGYFCVFSAVPDDPDPVMSNSDHVKYWFAAYPSGQGA